MDDEEDLEFSMFRTIFAVGLSSGVIGWNLAKPIPLLPSWLLGLIALIIGASSATLQDSLGDLLRLYGHIVNKSFGEVLSTADETKLRERTGIILSHVFFFLRGVDKQFNVMEKVQLLVAESIGMLTGLVLRARGLNPEPRPQRNDRTKRRNDRPQEEPYYGEEEGAEYRSSSYGAYDYDDREDYSRRSRRQ